MVSTHCVTQKRLIIEHDNVNCDVLLRTAVRDKLNNEHV